VRILAQYQALALTVARYDPQKPIEEMRMRQVHTADTRHWFITGASGGLGRHVVEYALQKGDFVTATVRRIPALDDLRQRYGDRLSVELLDLSPPADVDTVVTRVIEARPVDIVVNNAGYALVGAAEEMSIDQIRDQVEVLLIAPMLLTRAFLAPMREQGGGRIVQISSMGGQVAVPSHSAYHAGKWGLEGFTESVAQEVADFDIRLTVVEPGGTRTDFLSAMKFTQESKPYRDTAVGEIRRALRSADQGALTADPRMIAAIIYDTTRQSDPPLRLTLGLDSVESVHGALTRRLSALESQRALAASVTFPD
jgi:NAD(P)-dependent dehydrogenase (short-subunit alcohol dehydrogenase family)